MSNKNWVSIKDRPHYFSRNGKVMYKHSFVNPEGKSQQLYAPTKKEWELKKLEIEKNYKIVAGLDKDYSKATFQDMYQLWLEDAETYKVATLTRKKEFMNGKILPTFKDTVVSKVTAHQIENFYKAIEKNHTLKQVEETHRVLNQFFNFLINRQKCISVNPIPKHLIDGYKRRINNIKKEEQILEKAQRYSIPVLIDEAYWGFCPHSAFDLLDSYENLIIVRTFSKTAGLAGLRIGYTLSSKKIASLLYKFRPMYEVNSVAILFALNILDNWNIVDDYIAETENGKRWFLQELGNMSFRTIDTCTNFIHVDFGKDRDNILRLFKENDILIRGGLGVKGYENYIRISIGAITEMRKITDCILSRLV